MGNLWAITSYFNPASYRRKLQNYHIFRRRLAVPLVTVELSQSGLFELAPGDADVLIQLRGGDVMWQKERLLNVALGHLPPECVYIAWIDCDIVFDRENWAAAAVRELERTSLCQLFRTVYHLRQDAPPGAVGRELASSNKESIGYACALGLVTSTASTTDGIPGTFKRGHAWCARRELLVKHGFYDRNVIGNGDKVLVFAATGQVDDFMMDMGFAPAHAEDCRRWAAGFRREVSSVGYIDGDIFHLWHGDLQRRQYRARHQILRASNYDPAADIALDEQGCWRWNSPKWEMHRRVREYFWQREEDGVSNGLS
jgi:hypothetical protein